MSKTAVVFFIILLVIASCFIAGCSSLPFSGTPTPTERPKNITETPKNINVGLTGQDNSVTSQRYQFEDTAGGIFSTDLFVTGEDTSAINVSKERHIKSVRGTDLDETGDATSWTFVVQHGDQVSIITYNSQGMSVSSATGTINMTDIVPDQIISPRVLFEKNHAVIFNATPSSTTVSRDLSLGGGYYTLTISGQDAPRILVFDAKTGVLISSND